MAALFHQMNALFDGQTKEVREAIANHPNGGQLFFDLWNAGVMDQRKLTLKDIR